MINIILADDHPIVRRGLKTLLESEKGFHVIAETGLGIEAERLALLYKPDVVVLDIAMPDHNGIEVTREIKKRLPMTNVVILSMHSNELYVREALQAGATAYVLKESAMSELVMAIRKAAAGQPYLCSALPAVLAEMDHTQTKQLEQYKNLTSRERQVLYLISKGNTNAQIAERLFISTRTVEGHRSHIMHKLHIKNKAQLIHYALKFIESS